MDVELLKALANAGGYASVALAAVGSAMGTCIAGQAAIAAWKRCYVQNKPAPFLMVALAGAPLSQTIYAMILMVTMNGKINAAPQNWPVYIIIGILCGLAQMFSAIFQGKCAACGSVAFAESDKGFANYLMVLGIIETCAIFALVFSFMAMP